MSNPHQPASHVGCAHLLRLSVVCSALVLAGAPMLASAQSSASYPNRPIRFIVPFSPGGPSDQIARLITPKLGELMGQPFVVENRGGAGGSIGTAVVASAAPDGYTLGLLSQSSLTFAPWLYKNFPYDSAKDFTPITTVVLTPYMLVVNPGVPARTLPELIKLANGQKNFLTYGSSGPGSTSHIAVKLMEEATGLSMLHVPYKGTGPAITAVVAGEIDMMISDVGPILGHARSGRLRMVAPTGSKRAVVAPDLPTFKESGVMMRPLDGRFGLGGPAGLPKEMVAQLRAAVLKMLQTPEIKQRFATLGYDPVGDTPEEYAKAIRDDLAVFEKVITRAGLRVD